MPPPSKTKKGSSAGPKKKQGAAATKTKGKKKKAKEKVPAPPLPPPPRPPARRPLSPPPPPTVTLKLKLVHSLPSPSSPVASPSFDLVVPTTMTLEGLHGHLQERHGPIQDVEVYTSQHPRHVLDLSTPTAQQRTLADCGWDGQRQAVVFLYYAFKAALTDPLLLYEPPRCA